MASLLIKNGLVVDTEWTRHSDILVEGSRIRRIARNISVEDCRFNNVSKNGNNIQGARDVRFRNLYINGELVKE